MSTADHTPAPQGSPRKETDFLGERTIPRDALFGIHTVRAAENFPLSRHAVHPALVHAYGEVKRAAAAANRALGIWDTTPNKADAIERACSEMAEGLLDHAIIVDALQGGAGTSTNMNVNEVLANRALQLLGQNPGSYEIVSPHDDINLHQSTNDTYPTALKLGAIRMLRQLEEHLVSLQEAFQEKEKEFAHIVKIGRTELQDAVLITMGREMGAYADAIGRDRWRVYKCEERLRVVNLGGTAIGTGLAAPRDYIFRVVETLREQTGIGFARAENLVDNTQNADVFVEVSGILKACAATLLKISGDLRLMSSGPHSGFGEIRLPPVQAGSSIMPGKINPVIPEAIAQAALRVMGYDQQLSIAAGMGNLELNQYLPLIADSLLGSLELLSTATDILRRKCVRGIEPNEAKCREHIENSTSVATALVAPLGYEQAVRVAHEATSRGCSVRQAAVELGLVSEEEFDQLISPEAAMQLGYVRKRKPQ